MHLEKRPDAGSSLPYTADCGMPWEEEVDPSIYLHTSNAGLNIEILKERRLDPKRRHPRGY